MLSRDRIFEEAGNLLKARAADTVEVVVASERSATVRFAGSVFHQVGSAEDTEVYVRAIQGRKVGVASVNRLESMGWCLRRAVEIAGQVREEPFTPSLPGRQSYGEANSYFETTASMTIEEKAAVISRGFREAAGSGVLQSGSLTTEEGELAVMNSNGVEAYHPYTAAHLSVVSTKGDVSGLRIALAKDISSIDIPAEMNVSAERCLSALSPRGMAPGAYRVLLEPPAVAELLYWLSYTGMGAKNFIEGASFLSGRLGERVTGSNVTIYDDGGDPEGMSAPFDAEGVAKRRVPLIEAGIARGVAYDSFTASAEGSESTGNAQFPGDIEGPTPDHIFMEGGDKSPEELLEMLGSGILVRSFHYVNGFLNPPESLMTGMTRHGAFLVDNGRVKYPVSPMRFTENILAAFGRIEGASSSTELLPKHSFALSSISAPYLLIDGFSFTS